MYPEDRQKKIELLNRIKKGIISKTELQADYTISTFLDLMKVGSLSNEELHGKVIVLKEPMRSFFKNLKQKNEGEKT